MFCRNGFTIHNSWTRQKLFAVFLSSGILIYLLLIYQQTERLNERFDLFVSSAYYVGQSSLVRMIGTGSSSLRQTPLLCRNEHKEEVKAKIEEMGGPLQCKFWIFYVDCNFTMQSNEVTLFGTTNSEITIPVQSELTERYPLVVCYSRMFYYENWQIALLSIELYRHYGVQMFSIPIISVIEPLYRILKHYEDHKIVHLRNGVVLPKIEEMDPNIETEYFNQVISNTECLYRYRNAADFIAFVDFDDLIIPRNFPTLFEELQSLATFEPLASSFEFRWTRFNVEPSSKPSQFNIEKIISNAYFVQIGDVGKSIARPSRIRIGIMHRPYSSRDIDGNYTHKILTANDTLAFHLRSQTGDAQRFELQIPPIHNSQPFDLRGLLSTSKQTTAAEGDEGVFL
ncbi:Glycosyltransferase family 92 protein [Aphelenchoides besseyi]|nr:Glycosyltransferase family 92 protein [Aphelenchoides besseyi]